MDIEKEIKNTDIEIDIKRTFVLVKIMFLATYVCFGLGFILLIIGVFEEQIILLGFAGYYFFFFIMFGLLFMIFFNKHTILELKKQKC